MLDPCPGCGARFRASTGPTHRYIGASAGCWELFGVLATGAPPDAALLSGSSIPKTDPTPIRGTNVAPGSTLFGDAYAAQHHGGTSSQAVQSVAVHLLVLHASLVKGVALENRLWVIDRALRRRGVFEPLEPPPLGRALTIRHLFPGGGVVEPSTRHDYVVSVYEAWANLHAATIESWYDRFVVPDRLTPP